MESSKFRFDLPLRSSNTQAQGVLIMDNPPNTNKQLKQRTQVVPHDVIEIVEDDDGDDVLIIDKKVNMDNKGKSIIKKPAVCNGPVSFKRSSSSRKRKDHEIESWQQHVESMKNPVGNIGLIPPCQMSSKRKIAEVEPEILKKFRLFKHFDIVQDCSDHHFVREGSSKQATKKCSKTIQDDWKILEKDLPDTIFVRVYEERMDLLRAVIVGAAGTPYHDGLFFFDVSFPSNYPTSPPNVYYHSHGHRLNPNLYACGKVCLSLLNTWSGAKNEKWTPGKSTMLQVLLSIQALVLNAKPYFNEPGYARTAGTPAGEKYSQNYNESTFILSCKTMLHTLRNPPKHFKDLVDGYFHSRAIAILVACKAYTDGAQVGCLVEGGVQDLEEGQTSCSPGFKTSVQSMIVSLVEAFKKVGATNCEQFLPKPGQRINNVLPIHQKPILSIGHGTF